MPSLTEEEVLQDSFLNFSLFHRALIPFLALFNTKLTSVYLISFKRDSLTPNFINFYSFLPLFHIVLGKIYVVKLQKYLAVP